MPRALSLPELSILRLERRLLAAMPGWLLDVLHALLLIAVDWLCPKCGIVVHARRRPTCPVCDRPMLRK